MGTVILVVEDEALIAGDIQRTLQRLGYEVPLTVGTGKAALEATEKLRPQLILMDIKLRGEMDGIQTAQIVHAQYGFPIVYLTSHSDEATLARAMETEPHGYLLKPFNDRELRTAIEVALHKHEMETRLAAREKWFSTTLRSIGDAVIATDPQQIVTFMNEVAQKSTGWGEEGVGRPITEVFRLVDAGGNPIPGPMALAMEHRLTVTLAPNSRLVTRGGEQLAVEDSASPIIDDKGVLLGGVLVFRDVTEKLKLELRMAQSERVGSLGTMAAGVAHEINNPLTYVTANLDFSRDSLEETSTLLLLQKQTIPPKIFEQLSKELEDIQNALRDAADGAERVSKIVRKMDSFIQIQSSSRTPLQLPEVLEGAIRRFEGPGRPKILCEFSDTPPIDGNYELLMGVLANLFLNATQALAGREGGQIRVRSSRDDAGDSIVEVIDNGPGIAPEILGKVFDPFFTTRPTGHGMGLGLSMSLNIIIAHGGQLSVENDPSGGALFRMTFPPSHLL